MRDKLLLGLCNDAFSEPSIFSSQTIFVLVNRHSMNQVRHFIVDHYAENFTSVLPTQTKTSANLPFTSTQSPCFFFLTDFCNIPPFSN